QFAIGAPEFRLSRFPFADRGLDAGFGGANGFFGLEKNAGIERGRGKRLKREENIAGFDAVAGLKFDALQVTGDRRRNDKWIAQNRAAFLFDVFDKRSAFGGRDGNLNRGRTDRPNHGDRDSGEEEKREEFPDDRHNELLDGF